MLIHTSSQIVVDEGILKRNVCASVRLDICLPVRIVQDLVDRQFTLRSVINHGTKRNLVVVNSA